jgi:hypothetical protein
VVVVDGSPPGSNPAAPTIKYFEIKDLEACLVAGFFGFGDLSPY